MTNFLPKNTDQLDARPDPTHGDSPLSNPSVSDAAWLRGNVRSQDARLANDDKSTGYSNGIGRHRLWLICHPALSRISIIRWLQY